MKMEADWELREGKAQVERGRGKWKWNKDWEKESRELEKEKSFQIPAWKIETIELCHFFSRKKAIGLNLLQRK